jgi:hypothetical protein
VNRAGAAVAVILSGAAAGTAFGQAPPREPRPCVVKSSTGQPVTPRLAPRDDGPRRPDFEAFRRTLLGAVARKDADAVLAVVHTKARVSFDGAGGPAAFKSYHMDNPEEDFWTEFAAILRMGGRFRTSDEFDAPYTFAFWPDGTDSFECLAAIGTSVRLRERPTTESRALAVLNYDIVQRVLGDAPVPGWERVEIANGRRGFVASRYLRSPVDHRAMFAFEDDRWWLMAYIAGD